MSPKLMIGFGNSTGDNDTNMDDNNAQMVAAGGDPGALQQPMVAFQFPGPPPQPPQMLQRPLPFPPNPNPPKALMTPPPAHAQTPPAFSPQQERMVTIHQQTLTVANPASIPGPFIPGSPNREVYVLEEQNWAMRKECEAIDPGLNLTK